MNSRNDRKIKNLVINKGLQFRIIITAMNYMLLVLVVTLGAILFPVVYDMLTSTDLNIQYKAAQTFLVLAKRLLPCIVVLFILFFIHLLFVTHRICGPLVNFANSFSCIAEGDLTRKIQLRKGDYLRRESDQINLMIEGISTYVRNVKVGHGNMLVSLEEVRLLAEDPDVKTNIKESVDKMKNEANIVAEGLLNFKIDESEK